jgi:hypothetical protein
VGRYRKGPGETVTGPPPDRDDVGGLRSWPRLPESARAAALGAIGAVFLFRERLSAIEKAGIVGIAVGTAFVAVGA